jgi:hypothetical protein
MPKPNLPAMSVDALLKLRDDINKILDRKANELRSQLSMLGVAAERRRQAGPLKGRKVPPKYRSPSGETWAGRIALPPRPDVHRCWGYMSAVQDLSGFVDETGKRVLGFCPDPKTKLTQHIRVFTNYARTHPQELHEKASLLILRAMLNAFPCP